MSKGTSSIQWGKNISIIESCRGPRNSVWEEHRCVVSLRGGGRKEGIREDSVEEISSVWARPIYSARPKALGTSRKAFVMG